MSVQLENESSVLLPKSGKKDEYSQKRRGKK